MPTIDISDHTYRELERLARPFVETSPEDVIVRLIHEAAPGQNGSGHSQQRPKESPSAPGRALSSHAGSIPHGAKLRAKYKGRRYEAEVVDGQVHWNGRTFDSISAAAVAVIQSTGSRRGTENGWRFWEVQADGGRWIPASEFQS